LEDETDNKVEDRQGFYNISSHNSDAHSDCDLDHRREDYMSDYDIDFPTGTEDVVFDEEHFLEDNEISPGALEQQMYDPPILTTAAGQMYDPPILTTAAGAVATTVVQHTPSSDWIPGHALMNQCGSILIRNHHKLHTTRRQKTFL
jgi:hypothetical protein